MKIAEIRATPVNIPFKAPYRFSYGSMASVTKTIVEVVTDEGVLGWARLRTATARVTSCRCANACSASMCAI
jgi:L-alanine-DL-glutamate epimerase-like enolase superfamily enzyme